MSKIDIEQITKTIQHLYLEDSIPWVCGYSGGKDSTATLQLVWNAVSLLPEEMKNHKPIHVISTDTLVESPVVAAWVIQSLKKMQIAANNQSLPIQVHHLTPEINNTYWVNLLGRGYPYPRPIFRWCTSRLKIEPANRFIENMISAAGEAILVLGTRKAESSARRTVMESYERKRIRDHLSPNGALPNSFVFSPIEEWTSDFVWQYLMQYANPWGHSNKDLLAMYRGASSDGECPLVLDTASPSCGNSRFGCWVCTLVSEDKSMSAMIQNDEEKAWMLPLLDFRNEIAAEKEQDRSRRDFRRMNGKLTFFKGRLVHGPYTKATREYFLRRLLEVNQHILSEGPTELKDHPLITKEELQTIRKIWLDEKHEFDDSLPRIYKEVTGKEFLDSGISKNKYFGAKEWTLLSNVCKELFPEEQLLLEMQSSLLDIESKASLLSTRKGINRTLENIIRRSFYSNEDDAISFVKRHEKISSEHDNINPESFDEL